MVLCLVCFVRSFANQSIRREEGMAPVLDPTADLSHRYYELLIFMVQPNFQSVPGIQRRGFFRQLIQQQGKDRTHVERIKCNSHLPQLDTCIHNATATLQLLSTLAQICHIRR